MAQVCEFPIGTWFEVSEELGNQRNMRGGQYQVVEKDHGIVYVRKPGGTIKYSLLSTDEAEPVEAK